MATTDQYALGLVETRGLVAAIEAADAMAKSAQVKIISLENTVAAYVTIQISGETAAVQTAVDVGVAAAARVGEVVASHMIARPSPEVHELQYMGTPDNEKAVATKTSGKITSSPTRRGGLESMTVRELRALARRTSGLSIQGREIARANKGQLVKALSKITV